jgi:repressor LexA
LVNLTEKQKNIYNIIKEFIDKNGYSPTVREIGEIANLKSSATVDTYLEILEEKGYITSVRNKARTIRIVK